MTESQRLPGPGSLSSPRGLVAMLDDLRRIRVTIEARTDMAYYTYLLSSFLFCLLKLEVTPFQS